MTTYLVECYWPGVNEQLLTRAVEQLASCSSGHAHAVCWLSSILVPDDEIVLHVAEGSSADAVRASAQQAGVPTERIVSCVHVASPTGQAPSAVAVESSEVNQRRGGSSA
jgi:hypothetical protein